VTNGFEAILFDLDGVLLDSMWAHVASWQEVFGRRGLTVSAEFIYRHEGALGREVVDAILERAGRRLEEDELAELFEEQIALYLDKYVQRVRPYADALTTVDRLRSLGLRLGVVTSSRRPVVMAGLPPDLAGHFEVIVTADMVAKYKPHPEPYLKGLRDLAIEPAAALAVENAPAGIDSAHGAGLTVWALTTTLGPDHLGRAARIFTDLTDMAAFLKI
jgi:beta-phosphoglucomutase